MFEAVEAGKEFPKLVVGEEGHLNSCWMLWQSERISSPLLKFFLKFFNGLLTLTYRAQQAFQWPRPVRQRSQPYRHILLGRPCARVVSSESHSRRRHATATWHPPDDSTRSAVPEFPGLCTGIPRTRRRPPWFDLLPVDKLDARSHRLENTPGKPNWKWNRNWKYTQVKSDRRTSRGSCSESPENHFLF